MTRLHVYQSLWGMQRLVGERAHWSDEEQMRNIAAAGFDGVGVDVSDPVAAQQTVRLLREHGLRWWAGSFAASVDDFESTLGLLDALGAEDCDHVNLQPNLRPSTVLECIPYVLGCLDKARAAGVPLLFETHRDRMTTDLLFTLQLIDAVPQMQLTADLSHFVVAREFRWPISDENHELIRRILERSSAFHGRVATREQVQVQISYPHHRPWLELFMGWWEQGFRGWRDRADGDATLVFTTELGPPEWYAMTGPDGEEMSDRWEEALMLKDGVREIWRRLEGELVHAERA